MRKAKKKRKDETEQDSDSKLDAKQVWRHAQATRRRRMPNSSPRQNTGGGRMPQVFIHHNFRYGPEPPAYKTPKPEYPSYPRRETEKPVAHDRHIVREKSVDDRTIDRLIRRFLKDVTESDELPDEEDLLEPKPNKKNDELPDLTPRDLQRATRILEQQSRSEFQPIIHYVEKKSKELDEAKFDPERLLRQLETYPTEELQNKTLAELNSESRFVEEEIEGSKVETDTLPPTKPTSKGIEQHAENISSVEPEHAKPESDAIPSNKPDIERPLEQTTIDAYSELTQQTLPEIAPTSEAEILDDVQDLMHELEPEIEEQEEVEPSY